jgi:acetyl esterase/lipase
VNHHLVLALVTGLLVGSCGGDDSRERGAATTEVAPVTTIDPATTAAPTTISPSTTTITSVPTTSTPASDATSEPVVHPVAGDLAYATLSDLQRLDIYTPGVGEPPYGVIVIIHGGGWTVGDKRGELPLSAIPGFLALGYAVASVNYRLAPEDVFPAQLLDAKAAIRYVRTMAPTFGLDPDRIAVVGESAGGHLAALLATTQGRPEFDDPTLGNPDVSSAVQAVVDFYGPADLTTSDAQRALNPPCPSEPDPSIVALLGASPTEAPDLAAAASPVSYLAAGQVLAPFLIAHGDADCVVPYQQSVELHDAIEAVAPGRSQLVIVPGSGHYLDFDFASIQAAFTAFLNETIGRPAPG